MKYIIAAIIGAIIGYVTNWLAIKMLFRPHYEKRIFGIKIPFTPGLIPKEQKRIAASVGSAIGTHLLSKDTLVNSLCSNELISKIEGFVDKKIETVFLNSSNINDIINGSLIIDQNSLKEKLTVGTVNVIKNDLFQDKLSNYIYDNFLDLLKVDSDTVINSDLYNRIKGLIRLKSNNYINSSEFNKNVELILDSKLMTIYRENPKLSHIVPNNVVLDLKTLVYEKKSDISLMLKSSFEEEQVQYKLQQVITNTLQNNLSPMISMFINPSSVTEKVINEIKNFLSNENNHADIALIINSYIDKLGDKHLQDIISVPSKTIITELTSGIINNLEADSMINLLISSFEGNLSSKGTLDKALRELNIVSEENIKSFISKKIKALCNSDKAYSLANTLIDTALNADIKSYIGNVEKIKRSCNTYALAIYQSFIKNHAESFIETINVSKIVEEKINEFDVAFAEEIILDIANKELNAITWLGALLGGIMGILSPLLSNIY